MKYKIKYKSLDNAFDLGNHIKAWLRDSEREWTLFSMGVDGLEFIDKWEDNILHVGLESKIVAKHAIYLDNDADLGYTIINSSKFDNEELQFFDNLGFELSKKHEQKTGQVIESWF